MRILGIDPGLNATGYGILEECDGGFRVIEAGVLRSDGKRDMAERLLEISQELDNVIGQFEPDVVGLSCLLTVAFDAMKDTITAIDEAGLRDKVKIMIGGGVVDENLVPYVGADGFEQYASGAVTISKKWLGIKQD